MIQRLRDLGLSYDEAAHGMQTAVLHEMNLWEDNHYGNRIRGEVLRTHDTYPNGPKHLRAGVNSALVDNLAIASLLISKGVFTEAEYVEAVRLAMNEEVARYQDLHPGVTFR